MDMQTKVTLILTEIASSFQTIKDITIDEAHYSNLSLGENFFEFPEHYKATLRLESYESNCCILIQTYDNDELVKISNGNELILSPGGESESMIVPGYYEINIHIGNQVFCGLYKVKPSTVSWDRLMKIRDLLENLMSGLAQNLYCRKMGKQAGYVPQNHNMEEIYQHIVNSESRLIITLESLIKDPITTISKNYREQPYSKVPDMKSQKWLSKKGVSINSNSYIPEVNYEKHSFLDINTTENRWIKKILFHAIHSIVELESIYGNTQKINKDKMNEKRDELKEAIVKCNLLKTQRNIAYSEKKRSEERVRVLSKTIDTYQKRNDSIQERLNNLKRIKTSLAHYEYETWLKEITGYEKTFKPSLTMLKENRYLCVYSFYKKLLLMEKDRLGKKTSFPFKKTSLLFEYYTVAVVINILQSLEYVWESGWLADSLDPRIFYGELPTETNITFVKDNLLLELVYDKEVSREPNDLNKSQIVNFNSKHNRPDIMITVFDNDTGQLLDCIILEVKCSKSKYLYSNIGDTDAMVQIRDYCSFRYWNADSREKKPGGVSKTILVYPKQDNPILHSPLFNDPFNFIQLDPASDDGLGGEQLYWELKTFFEKLELSNRQQEQKAL